MCDAAGLAVGGVQPLAFTAEYAGYCGVFQIFQHFGMREPEFWVIFAKNAAFFNFSNTLRANGYGKVEKRRKSALKPLDIEASGLNMSEKLKFAAFASVSTFRHRRKGMPW